MHGAAAIAGKDEVPSVGSVSDKMAAELYNFDGHLSKRDSAERLYCTGFAQSDIIEHLDEAIEKARALARGAR